MCDIEHFQFWLTVGDGLLCNSYAFIKDSCTHDLMLFGCQSDGLTNLFLCGQRIKTKAALTEVRGRFRIGNIL